MSGIHLDDYHAAVCLYLQTEMPFLQSVETYPEVYKGLATPCAFFGVLDWDKASRQPQNGQIKQSLNCQILLISSSNGEENHKRLRNLAMLTSLKIDQANFGLRVDPAEFVSAEPWAFEPNLEQYDVWAVNFVHNIEVGIDEFAAMPDFLPSAVSVAGQGGEFTEVDPDV